MDSFCSTALHARRSVAPSATLLHPSRVPAPRLPATPRLRYKFVSQMSAGPFPCLHRASFPLPNSAQTLATPSLLLISFSIERMTISVRVSRLSLIRFNTGVFPYLVLLFSRRAALPQPPPSERGLRSKESLLNFHAACRIKPALRAREFFRPAFLLRPAVSRGRKQRKDPL